jgi:hypothetical protein
VDCISICHYVPYEICSYGGVNICVYIVVQAFKRHEHCVIMYFCGLILLLTLDLYKSVEIPVGNSYNKILQESLTSIALTVQKVLLH